MNTESAGKILKIAYEVGCSASTVNKLAKKIHFTSQTSDGSGDLDASILKKLIPKFIQKKIKINLSNAENTRIKELYNECLNES